MWYRRKLKYRIQLSSWFIYCRYLRVIIIPLRLLLSFWPIFISPTLLSLCCYRNIINTSLSFVLFINRKDPILPLMLRSYIIIIINIPVVPIGKHRHSYPFIRCGLHFDLLLFGHLGGSIRRFISHRGHYFISIYLISWSRNCILIPQAIIYYYIIIMDYFFHHKTGGSLWGRNSSRWSVIIQVWIPLQIYI